MCSTLKSGITGKNLGKSYPLSESGTHIGFDLRNKMAAKLRIDGSRLAGDNFADVLIDEDKKYSPTVIPTVN